MQWVFGRATEPTQTRHNDRGARRVLTRNACWIMSEISVTMTPLDPLVSVVVPSYNRAHTIAETIESLLAQTYPRLEIIIVDDGSKDDTERVVAPFLDRIVYVRQENKGLAGARNTGHARSTGDYIAWLDSDDLWNPEKAALQVAFMQAHPDNVLIGTDFSAFDGEGFFEASHASVYYSVFNRAGGLPGLFPERELVNTRAVPHLPPGLPETVPVFHGNVYESLVGGNFLHPPTVMFRRDAMIQAGSLEPVFHHGTDYEYFLRLSRLGRVAFIDRPLMRYRYSPDQMSSPKNREALALSLVRVLESLRARDPALLRRRSFRRRLGYSHLEVAHALADTRSRPAAARHLLTSFRWGHLGADTAKTVAKICLPDWVVDRLRKNPAGAAS
jgi:glycosyltransferase involved in cell wall biosynthesis